MFLKTITAGVEAGKLYNDTVREKGKGHGLGPPFTHVALSMLEARRPKSRRTSRENGSRTNDAKHFVIDFD